MVTISELLNRLKCERSYFYFDPHWPEICRAWWTYLSAPSEPNYLKETTRSSRIIPPEYLATVCQVAFLNSARYSANKQSNFCELEREHHQRRGVGSSAFVGGTRIKKWSIDRLSGRRWQWEGKHTPKQNNRHEVVCTVCPRTFASKCPLRAHRHRRVCAEPTSGNAGKTNSDKPK